MSWCSKNKKFSLINRGKIEGVHEQIRKVVANENCLWLTTSYKGVIRINFINNDLNNFKIESNKVELLVTKWGKCQILVKDPLNPELQEIIGSKTAYGIYGGSYGDWDWNPDEKPFNNK